jgi:sigma-E factor negative regulatory protein RseA
MSEQEQMSQLSALFDNELPPAEAELVIRRLLKDPALRARWERYALIGACVRGEPIHASARQPDVAERVRRRLAAEAQRPQAAGQAVAPWPGERRGWSQFARGALGGSIAASVAALALFLVQSMGPHAADPAVQMANVAVPAADTDQARIAQVTPPAVQAPALLAAADSPPPSYTTPMDNSSQRISGPLLNYVVAHSEVAASAGRLLPLSAAMNGNYDVAQGTVKMTEAQIEAYR